MTDTKTAKVVFIVGPLGFAPARGSTHAAGWDLCAIKDFTVPAGMRYTHPIDVYSAIPHGHYGRIAPRSGLAHKLGIDILAGVIDSDYRDPIGVILLNTGDLPFEVKRGDRIAQIIIEKIFDGEIEFRGAMPMPAGTTVAEIKAMLPAADSTRDGGFGSTGIRGPVAPSPSP